ncbi:MAG: Gfo/Idh/MocA family oxidoreductase, partial [Patescibacteria group bacterium]
KHFFVEATTRNDGYDDLQPLLDGSFVAAPSCTFRHFPAVVKIKELLLSGLIGKPLSFNHYLGQYLPDWHPYEDYRQIYFAKKDTGGAREMFPYELIWLMGIFQSQVARVIGARGKISDLEMTADDVYHSIIQFENGMVGNMMIDILNRNATRTLKIIGTEGTLDWNWLGKKIEIYDAKIKSTKIIDLTDGKKIGKYNTGEEAYESEMSDFLEAIEGKKKYPYSFEEDDKILSFLDNFIDIKS